MKLLRLLFFILLTAQLSIAQTNSVNYKALVKDNTGNIIANQSIDIQFIIYQGPGEITNVYQETHSSVMTDANGIAIVNIGGGTTTDDFKSIDWASDDHYLNVQIDTGGGLTDMGTTAFSAVPYAIQAENANTANSAIIASNVSGLEQLTEGGQTGHRIIGRSPANYGNIGNDAIDVSFADGLGSGNEGATGQFSFASGYNTTAFGTRSIAMGGVTTASGDESIAIGVSSTASGGSSIALGSGLLAKSYREAVIGSYNTDYTPNNTTTFNNADRLFVVGNGSSNASRSDAFTVLKNGQVGIAQSSPTADLHIKQSTANENGSGGIRLEDSADTDEWKIYHSGLHLSFAENGTRLAYIQAGTGSFIDISDRKFKNSINKMTPVLDRVLKLQPSTYFYNHQKNKTNKVIGLIAQEVQPLFPEIVSVSNDGSLGISYANLGVIAMKAIQEQQEIISDQNKVIEEQNKAIQELLKRVEKLENKNK